MENSSHIFGKSRSLDGNFILSVTKKHQAARMRENQKKAKPNPVPAEIHAKKIIEEYGIKFSTQAIWQSRIFDFWFSGKGIAIEIDGPSHKESGQAFKDMVTDKHFYAISGIIVIRVANFDDNSLRKAMETICNSCTWKDRRETLCLGNARKVRRRLGI